MEDTVQPQLKVEQQAVEALAHLDDKAKARVLEYIHSLVKLDQAKNDKGSSTKN